MRVKPQIAHELLAALDAYQEIVCRRGVGYVKLTPEIAASLTPPEREAWERAQARRRQHLKLEEKH